MKVRESVELQDVEQEEAFDERPVERVWKGQLQTEQSMFPTGEGREKRWGAGSRDTPVRKDAVVRTWREENQEQEVLKVQLQVGGKGEEWKCSPSSLYFLPTLDTSVTSISSLAAIRLTVPSTPSINQTCNCRESQTGRWKRTRVKRPSEEQGVSSPLSLFLFLP